MAVFAHPERHRVAVLVRQRLLPMELGIVHQLFGQAASATGDLLYEVRTCGVEIGEVSTTSDFVLQVDNGPATLAEADTVIVPAAGEDYAPAADGSLPEPLAHALGFIRPGTRIASICTGAFVLAGAGLLDGRRATTHWKSAPLFRSLYPKVLLEEDVLYVDEGDVLTSAGEASGIDLCLHMIRRDFGAAVANDVARSTVVPPHRDGGQAQFIRRPVSESPSSSTAKARAWALENLDRPLSLGQLAARESMSRRTFTRRFREETGMSPAQWLSRQRLERARELLENTDLPIDRVAEDAGFGTATSLRQHMRAFLGVSPAAYRRTFRGPGQTGRGDKVVHR